MSIRRIVELAGLVWISGCARKPTADECKAAWQHVIEVQIDELDPARIAEQMSGFFGKTTPDEKRFMEEKAPEQKQWLRSQIPALLTPEVLSLCERRMKRTDIECTLAARTTSELVEKCRWKPTPGPRGMGLGWE